MSAETIGHNSGRADAPTGGRLADPPELVELTEQINKDLIEADASRQQARDAYKAGHAHLAAERDHLLDAGRKLLQARFILEAIRPGASWRKWCDEHIQYSYSKVYRLLKIAQSSDPKAALAKLRDDDRDRKAASRRAISRSW